MYYTYIHIWSDLTRDEYCSLSRQWKILISNIHFEAICNSFFMLQEGRTALALASWEGHLSVVQVLVSKGADPNIQDEVCVAFFTSLDDPTWI